MSVKKSRDFRFTFQDADGAIRVVYLQAQHFRESGHDRIVVQATTDGVEIETRVYEDPKLATRRVKTQTELSG